MIISLIAAMSVNGVIGDKNTIPWYLPVDFNYFKTITTGHNIIMGRKTFESIGKPLPNRKNIIISSEYPESEKYIVAKSLIDALNIPSESDEIFIIGGKTIYEQSLPIVDKLYITEINTTISGDTLFPYFDKSKWRLTSSINYLKDEKNAFNMCFNVYERI